MLHPSLCKFRYWAIILPALILTLALATPALAQGPTCTVSTTADSGAGSLRQCLTDVDAGGTVNFSLTTPATITLTSGELTIDKALTITGPGAGNLAISGNNAVRVFNIDATSTDVITIAHLTIRDGDGGSGFGGGIRSEGADLTLSNVTLYNNSADNGGGMYVHDNNVTLIETQVLSNTAGTSGGGLNVYKSSVTLTNTQILSNTAGDNGGGLYKNDSSGLVTMANGAVNNNAAVDDGGGLYVRNGGIAILSGTQVFSNTAGEEGGGLFLYTSTSLTMEGGVVDDNYARSKGGGLYSYNGSATLNGTQVLSNTANNSVGYGGGLYIDGGSGSLTMAGGTVNYNSARDGGGLYVYNGSAELHNTPILSNFAIGSGNSTDGGGGLYITGNTGSVTMDGGAVNGNATARRGGGLYVGNGNATMTNTQILSVHFAV